LDTSAASFDLNHPLHANLSRVKLTGWRQHGHGAVSVSVTGVFRLVVETESRNLLKLGLQHLKQLPLIGFDSD
jgi:hypothetical protein